MTNPSYSFTEKLWLYPGKASWHFITVPQDISQDIKKNYEGFSRGWDSFKVSVTIADSTWLTSIFPDKKTKTFVLPVKVAIREKEQLKKGDDVFVSIEILL